MSFKKDMKNKYYVKSESNIDDIKQNLTFKEKQQFTFNEKQRKGISPKLIYGLMTLTPIVVFVLVITIIITHPAQSAMKGDSSPDLNHTEPTAEQTPTYEPEGHKNSDAEISGNPMFEDVVKLVYKNNNFYVVENNNEVLLSTYDLTAYNKIIELNYVIDENNQHISFNNLTEGQELYLVDKTKVYIYDIRISHQ